MFLELERRRFPFSVGNAVFYLRFDNKALLEIERSGFDIFDFNAERLTVKAAKCFLAHGLRTYAEEETFEADTEEYSWALADRLIKLLSPKEISAVIAAAVLEAMPEPIIGAKSDKNEKADFSRIFCYFCDIMGKPEELFWDLTLREVFQRWDAYAVFHGYKEAPLEVKRFDD